MLAGILFVVSAYWFYLLLAMIGRAISGWL
jgi:hypothetical protein